MGERTGLASVNLGKTKEIALRLVAEGHYENVSEACRAGLRRLEAERKYADMLVGLAEEGLASGVDEDFDIDAFIAEIEPEK
jgi:putative addiction module CopG family antidote